MSENVFILGAGASRHAGAPLMADFLDAADLIRRAPTPDPEKAHFDRVFDALSSLQAVHSKAELDITNLESVYGAFEMATLVGVLPGLSTTDIAQLPVSTRKVIVRTLEKTVRYPVEKDDGRAGPRPTSEYASFAGTLKDLYSGRPSRRSAVMTFNYDIALDFALHWHGINADFCLNEPAAGSAVAVMKLHGSINWAVCPKCGAIAPFALGDFFRKFQWPMIQELSDVALDLASSLGRAGFAHCPGVACEDVLIVPPTWNKTQHHSRIETVWKRAARELADAENIFIVGYSHPAADAFFRYLYALGSQGKASIKKFWVFDPDPEVEERYRERLIGAGVRSRFQFFRKTFKDALADIRGALGLKSGGVTVW